MKLTVTLLIFVGFLRKAKGDYLKMKFIYIPILGGGDECKNRMVVMEPYQSLGKFYFIRSTLLYLLKKPYFITAIHES